MDGSNSDATGHDASDTGYGFTFAEFDESLFLETERTSKNVARSYNAKICNAKWFKESDNHNVDDLEKMKVVKYQADFAYLEEDYPRAVKAYKCCLERMGDVLYNSSGMRREILDAMARCYIRLQEYDKALEIALNLYKESANTTEQKITTLTLMFNVYQANSDIDQECVTIQRLLILNSYNPRLWYKLAMNYKLQFSNQQFHSHVTNMDSTKHQFGIKGPENCQDSNNEGCHDALEPRIYLCLLRARIMCSTLNRNATSFFKSKMNSLLKDINELMKDINISDAPKSEIYKSVKEHLTEESDCESAGAKEFEILAQDDKTFQKYFDSLWFEGFH